MVRRHELVGRLEAVALSAAVDDEVDVEVSAGRHDLLRALGVAELSDDRRRRVDAVTDHDEIRTVRTAANNNRSLVKRDELDPLHKRTQMCLYIYLLASILRTCTAHVLCSYFFFFSLFKLFRILFYHCVALSQACTLVTMFLIKLYCIINLNSHNTV